MMQGFFSKFGDMPLKAFLMRFAWQLKEGT
jgi:hypothetical protein